MPESTMESKMSKAKLSNFAVTLNGAVIRIAGIALTFETANQAALELLRRKSLAAMGALPKGEYEIKAVRS